MTSLETATIPAPWPRVYQRSRNRARLTRRTPEWAQPRRLLQATVLFAVILLVLGAVAWVGGRYWVRHAASASLPQLDGTLSVAGLAGQVTVQRDAQGVPHIRAQSLDDLLRAQGFITAQDRLFQMDLLRRHAAGELAEVLGSSLVAHDRLQRVLQIRAAADRAVAQLPPDQLHMLQQYADGVNAEMAQQEDAGHLPLEFRLLRYKPRPWVPRDSLLVSLAMFEDLTNGYPGKLARESLTARLPPELVADMYPVGSWRDHPPTTPEPDLTIPGPPIEQVPLDESQAALHLPDLPGFRSSDNRGAPGGGGGGGGVSHLRPGFSRTQPAQSAPPEATTGWSAARIPRRASRCCQTICICSTPFRASGMRLIWRRRWLVRQSRCTWPASAFRGCR